MEPTGPVRSGAGAQWRVVLCPGKSLLSPRARSHYKQNDASILSIFRKPLLAQAKNFTLFIKNTVTFSKFNFSR